MRGDSNLVGGRRIDNISEGNEWMGGGKVTSVAIFRLGHRFNIVLNHNVLLHFHAVVLRPFDKPFFGVLMVVDWNG